MATKFCSTGRDLTFFGGSDPMLYIRSYRTMQGSCYVFSQVQHQNDPRSCSCLCTSSLLWQALFWQAGRNGSQLQRTWQPPVAKCYKDTVKPRYNEVVLAAKNLVISRFDCFRTILAPGNEKNQGCFSPDSAFMSNILTNCKKKKKKPSPLSHLILVSRFCCC